MAGRSRTARAAALLDARPLRALLARLPTWRGALVLNYHRIGERAGQPWDRTLWSATAEGFDEQLAFLARHVDVIGPHDLPAVAAAGRGRFVLLTFDDGYRDNYEIAYPLLRRHRLEATFFLSTGFLDRPHIAWWDELAWMVRTARTAVVEPSEWLPQAVPLDGDREAAIAALVRAYKALQGDQDAPYLEHVAAATGAGRCTPAHADGMWMTWAMARELRDGGMTIGGHTVSHPLLARLSEAEQEREVGGCARRLREELDLPMRWFSYPVGSRDAFTPATQALLARHGVELAFSFYGGHARFSRWRPLDVSRVHVGPAVERRHLQALARLPQLFARPD
ncbi:MAG TPA: polysaccharide deacetylase family protein [Conexibacter sp.]|nr:polysaccharide deacetylase family protein [Conexibacter sp.]